MRTLAVINQKGGSGKTTTTVNLAAAIGDRGKRTLVVDLDPQAAASSWLGVQDGSRGLFEVFTEGRGLMDVVQATAVPGVELVPASSWLVGVERAVAGVPDAEGIFRRAVAKLPKRWDLVLLDCPPSLTLLSVSALLAASGVLVPVEASSLALAGLAGLLETVEGVRERNAALTVAGILAVRVDGRTNLGRDVVEHLRRQFPALMFKTTIRESVRLKEAWGFSQPVTTYAPASRGAEDYRHLAAEVLNRLRRS